MKKIILNGIWIALSLFIFAACSPQEDERLALGDLGTITSDMISFSQTPSTKSKNIITFKNTSNVKHSTLATWDLGNGSTAKGDSVTATYPMKGNYTVVLTLYAADGSSASYSQVIKIDNDDFGLINTPAYRNLTGGIENANGKVWVLDQYNNFASEVAKATGLSIKGHMGLGPENSYGQDWWGAGPNEKNTWKLYDFKFKFVQNGAKLTITNSGEGYGRKAVATTPGGFSVTGTNGDDAFFTYNGGNYSFSIKEGGKYPVLTLSGNAFMGYYCGSQDYDIVYQTDKVMALRVDDKAEGQDWVFVYCLQELNVAAPPVVKQPKAIPLSENFESGKFTVNFQTQDMGSLSGIVDNPAPVPINESLKVYRYQKTDAFYSNMYFAAPDYKFDLTQQNKIHIKVYIPSYNDYDTQNAVAGDWIAEKRLRPQLSVKLQNNDLGGNSWQTQTEIIQKDLPLDKWVDLIFDFSGVSSRQDYDKIVIQFGGEGHSGKGIFFFDDFSFTN